MELLRKSHEAYDVFPIRNKYVFVVFLLEFHLHMPKNRAPKNPISKKLDIVSF